MTNEIAVQQLTPQQRGWLNMAIAKNSLIEDLTKLSLSAQAILLKPVVTITDREQQLKDYGSAYRAIGKFRLDSEFIKRINALQDELMKYEKEADPKNNEKYKSLESELIALKRAEAAKAQEANLKNAEIAQYKAHIQNQIDGMISDFKVRALSEINVMYKQAVASHDLHLLPEVEKTISMMQFKQPVTFIRTRITNEESDQIKTGFQKPDLVAVRAQMIEEARRIFINLESDIASGTAPDITEQIEQVQVEAKENELINALVAEVSVPEIAPEGKSLKEALEIELIETESFADAIFVNWLKNKEAAKHLRVKKWSALTVAQMATALGKHATEKDIKHYPGLVMKKVTSL